MSVTVSPEVIALLSESAEWRLLGLLFEYPTPLWRHSLTALLPDLSSVSLTAMAQPNLKTRKRQDYGYLLEYRTRW